MDRGFGFFLITLGVLILRSSAGILDTLFANPLFWPTLLITLGVLSIISNYVIGLKFFNGFIGSIIGLSILFYIFSYGFFPSTTTYDSYYPYGNYYIDLSAGEINVEGVYAKEVQNYFSGN